MFLRGVGVPEILIEHVRSLTGRALEFYTCFISFTEADDGFSQRLHNDLQDVEFLSHDEFRHCVNRYDGNQRIRRLSCWEQFLAMAFAQLTYRESLRDIEVCLAAQQSKLYHSGFGAPIKRSTLADANESRDWRIYADFAQTLISIARPLYADTDLGFDLRTEHSQVTANFSRVSEPLNESETVTFRI